MPVYVEGALKAVDRQVQQETDAAGQMRLGAFIAALEQMPLEAIIRYDIGSHPGNPLSYRGYYDHLAFGYDGPCAVTVSGILAAATGSMGRHFEGYKGGSYVMHENTPVWAASYGTSSDGRRIVGVVERGDFVVIRTVPESDT